MTDAEKQLHGAMTKVNKIVSNVTKAAAAGFGVFGGAITASAGALMSLASNTEDYRVAQGKLNTAFDAAGLSAQAAQDAYDGLFAILGDSDTATEASQLLAKLTKSEKDLSKWTDIAAGVYGTFGDALPIEGLIEAANETQKTGAVVGQLADALNWAGISEDNFNAALEKLSTEEQRNQLIMSTLTSAYSDATSAFYQNNAAVVTARENQARMDRALADLGGTVANIKNQLVGDFTPALVNVVSAFSDVISNVEGSDVAFSEAVGGLVEKATEKLPEFLGLGGDIIMAVVNGIAENADELAVSAVDSVGVLVDEFTDNLPELLVTGTKMLLEIASGIIEATPELIEKVPDVVDAVGEAFEEAAPELEEIGRELARNIAAGYMDITDFLYKISDGLLGGAFQGIVGVRDANGNYFDSYSDFEYEMKTVGEADGMIGKATAAIINNASSLASTASTPNGPVNINLVTAEGDVMARWMLPSLIDVAKANGTPIQNNVLGGG